MYGNGPPRFGADYCVRDPGPREKSENKLCIDGKWVREND